MGHDFVKELGWPRESGNFQRLRSRDSAVVICPNVDIYFFWNLLVSNFDWIHGKTPWGTPRIHLNLRVTWRIQRWRSWSRFLPAGSRHRFFEDMDKPFLQVSWNGGTPKSSIISRLFQYKQFRNHPFLGTSFQETTISILWNIPVIISDII